MDPSSSSSNCEKIDESIEDGVAEEVSGINTSSSHCEDFSDGDAGDELGVELIRAAIDGDEKIFDEPNLINEHFLRKTREEDNILHIAVRYKQTEFVRAFLEKYFAINNNKKKKLIIERNSQGNTPLHVAAEVKGVADRIVELLYNYLKESVEDGDEGDQKKPWRAQNSEGNTALHVALLYHNTSVADFLAKRDGGLARIVNKSKEAPLHLAITNLLPINCDIMIKVLLEKARFVASWRDAKGLTPLLRAASVDPFTIKLVTNQIIRVCPESTLVCDPSGKSFLHLLIYNKVFDVSQEKKIRPSDHNDIEDVICLKEICILKDQKDKDGNTPLHIAAICKNVPMVRSLRFKCQADPLSKNNDGILPMSIIPFEPSRMTEEEFNLANKGDVESILQINDNTIVISQDATTGSTFLHLLMNTTAIHHYFSSDDCKKVLFFVQETLLHFPESVCEIDQSGNTPVHILVQNKDFCRSMANPATLWESSLLSELLSICAKAITEIICIVYNLVMPWMMQNENGNTPLHEALIANNKVLVLQLLNYCKESAQLVNTRKETPLHLLADIGMGMEEFTHEEIMKMVNANFEALGLRDNDDLIPISRAVKARNLNMVVTLLSNGQKFSHSDGKIFWHLLIKHRSKNFVSALLKNEEIKKMLELKDEDGVTPLHLAIKEKCFSFIQVLLETCGNEIESSMEDQWLMDLLRISNNDVETPEDLLAELPTLPPELEKKLLTDHRTRGIRSSWRIPRTQLQNYMNSMNVIAALQTTITFTAAFTVPGGLIQDTGTPVLIQSIIFQIFMISDVIAMCLSMMVLICLLWMVATDKRESVMIQDFAITLLLASFFATLLTFMTGVYATISPVKPWIAIVTLVLCSLLMLLVHRFMVTRLLLPFKNAISNFVQMLLRPAAKAFKKMMNGDESQRTRHQDYSDTSPHVV